MSCPTDEKKCPVGQAAEIRTYGYDQVVSTYQTWRNSDIRVKTFCKISIKHNAQVPDSRWERVNMNVQIESLEKAEVHIVVMPASGNFRYA